MLVGHRVAAMCVARRNPDVVPRDLADPVEQVATPTRPGTEQPLAVGAVCPGERAVLVPQPSPSPEYPLDHDLAAHEGNERAEQARTDAERPDQQEKDAAGLAADL